MGRATQSPRPKLSAMLAGGRTHDAGRSRVSVRRSVQAVRGLVFVNDPALAQEPLSPALAYRLVSGRRRASGPSFVRSANCLIHGFDRRM